MNAVHEAVAAAPITVIDDGRPWSFTPVLDRFSETARLIREIDRAEAAHNETLPLWSVSVTIDGIEAKEAKRSITGSELAAIEVSKLAQAEADGESCDEIVIRVRKVP